MQKIITATEAQKKICGDSLDLKENWYVITKRGKGKMILLPYFEGCDREIEDMIENLEMYANRDKLKKRWQESLDSGISDFVI